jgi:protein TonB
MKFIFTLILFFSFHSIRAQSDSTQIPKTDSAIYYKPEVEATYPGGIAVWYKYLTRTMVYPSAAENNNISGRVYIQFVVETDGSTHDYVAISGPGELRKESIRVIKKSGKWVPATLGGKNVKSYKVQALNYKIVL